MILNANPQAKLNASVSLIHRLKILCAREMMTRFTGDRLGYLWTFVAPLAWIILTYVVFDFMGRGSPVDGNLFGFLVSGMIPYISFRYTITSVLRARSVITPLGIIPGLSRNIIVLSVTLVEFYSYGLLFMLLLMLNWMYADEGIHNALLTLFGFTLAWGMGAACGYMTAALSTISPFFLRALPVLLRPMLFVSGVFYTASELPSGILQYLQYNPLFIAVEISRSGIYPHYDSPATDFMQPLLWIFAMLAIGWMSVQTSQAKPVPELET